MPEAIVKGATRAAADSATKDAAAVARRRIARFAGWSYLAFVALSIAAGALGHIGTGDPAQVYSAILGEEPAFRAGLAAAFASALCFVAAAWGLYVLLKPVDEGLAALFLLLNALGAAIQCSAMASLLSALSQGEAALGMDAFTKAQLAGLGRLSAATYKAGFVSAQLFFGAWLFPLGRLVYRSGFLPKFLGALLAVDGVAIVWWFLQATLLPSMPYLSYPGFAVSFAAEVGLGLWLVVKGA